MKMYVALHPFGVVVCDEKGKVVDKEGFGKDKRVESLLMCSGKKVCGVEKKLIDRIKGRFKDVEFVFELEKEGYKSEFPNPAGEYVRRNFENIVNTDSKEIRRVYALYSKYRIKEKIGKDRVIVQVVNAIDEIEKIVNTMHMRLKEWYLWYFPELFDVLKSNDAITKYVADTGYRTDFKGIEVEDSAGLDLDKRDVEEIRNYAKRILELKEEKKALENYLDNMVKENMPNMYEIAGGVLTARLIEHAGSLERLAMFPSSTIQILGAEKALFMFLKGKGKSPKHGLIFMSSYIQRTPKKYRGKVARILAQKLSIASKLDYYGGEFKGKEYKDELENLVTNLKK